MITIERIEESCESSEEEKQAYCKVKIEFNFEGEEDYFRTEIMGETTYLLECALEAFSKWGFIKRVSHNLWTNWFFHTIYIWRFKNRRNKKSMNNDLLIYQK